MKIESIRLFYRSDVLMADFGEDQLPVPVRLIYARPISNREGEISVAEAKGTRELAWIESLDQLNQASREVAQEELARRYRIALIHEVPHSLVNHGHRYLRVKTDRGDRHFNLKEPGKNVTWVNSDHLILRDSMGNRYEVPSIEALDPGSRRRLLLVL